MPTRKSNRIQDQGIPMQEKEAMLKSIQNLESQGNTDHNSFNILSNASFSYLENMAVSCGISLGSHTESPQEVISAMQAQELARAALAKAKLEKGKSSEQNVEGDYKEDSRDEDVQLEMVDNVSRGVVGFKLGKRVSSRLKKIRICETPNLQLGTHCVCLCHSLD